MNNKPTIEEDAHGNKWWWLNGNIHREDGPAVEWKNGNKQWWLNGKRHRIDGPACESVDGYNYWFLNDKEYTQIEWFQQLTPEQQYNYLWNLDE
jgi:hypothetical protein